MGKLGEVVFCIDCDAGREQDPESPRRMATKRDVNGDPLCTTCLDARHERRRGAFLLHEGRAPLPASGAGRAPETEQAGSTSPPRRLSATRVVRTRERAASAAQAGPVVLERKLPRPRIPNVSRRRERALERRFLLVATELGFLRAQQMLDDMSQALDAIRRGSAPRRDPRGGQ